MLNRLLRLSLLLTMIFSPGFIYSAELGWADPDTLPDDPDEDLEDDERALQISLGKKLFFDNDLSGDRSMSCATCHNPDFGYSDGMVTSLGSKGKVPRNSPTIYNLAWAPVLLWDGRANDINDMAVKPIKAGKVMNLPYPELLKRLKANKEYPKMFKKLYDDGITVVNIGKAIGAFERSIIVNDSPFDRYMKGDKAAMIPEAVNGLAIFKGKGKCVKCHDGINLTDYSFHNIGLKSKDIGRGKFDKKYMNAFKTPGLRNIALTSPYMHDGSLGTLDEVVDFYDRGGDVKNKALSPLKLTDKEKRDLISFLGALTSK